MTLSQGAASGGGAASAASMQVSRTDGLEQNAADAEEDWETAWDEGQQPGKVGANGLTSHGNIAHMGRANGFSGSSSGRDPSSRQHQQPMQQQEGKDSKHPGSQNRQQRQPRQQSAQPKPQPLKQKGRGRFSFGVEGIQGSMYSDCVDKWDDEDNDDDLESVPESQEGPVAEPRSAARLQAAASSGSQGAVTGRQISAGESRSKPGMRSVGQDGGVGKGAVQDRKHGSREGSPADQRKAGKGQLGGTGLAPATTSHEERPSYTGTRDANSSARTTVEGPHLGPSLASSEVDSLASRMSVLGAGPTPIVEGGSEATASSRHTGQISKTARPASDCAGAAVGSFHSAGRVTGSSAASGGNKGSGAASGASSSAAHKERERESDSFWSSRTSAASQHRAWEDEPGLSTWASSASASSGRQQSTSSGAAEATHFSEDDLASVPFRGKHVLEAYDLTSAVRTQDLEALLLRYAADVVYHPRPAGHEGEPQAAADSRAGAPSRGPGSQLPADVRWQDDCHALLVFLDVQAAETFLDWYSSTGGGGGGGGRGTGIGASDAPLLPVRPLGPTSPIFSKLRRRELDPPRPRPKTNAMAAQRMIAGASDRATAQAIRAAAAAAAGAQGHRTPAELLRAQEAERRKRLEERRRLKEEAWGED